MMVLLIDLPYLLKHGKQLEWQNDVVFDIDAT